MGTTNGKLTTSPPVDTGSVDPGGRTITITIEPGHGAVVNRIVQAVERSWKIWKRADLPGIAINRRGQVHMPAGLIPTLRRELVKDGFRVNVQDQRPQDLQGNVAILDQAEGGDRRYLEALLHNPLGVIEVNDNTELITRLTQLTALFPEAKVVVAVATRKLAWQIWRALGKQLNYPVGLITAHTHKPGRRCIVCSYRMLQKLDNAKKSILAIIEAERAIGTVAEFTMGSRAYARIYGFVFADVTRDESADLALQALAGELIYTTSSTAILKRVLMIPAPAVPVKSWGRGLQRKRRTIWHNRPRNRWVARVARAFLERDSATLREYGIHLDGIEIKSIKRVVVMVESTAHARELRSLLRDWPIFDAVPLELKKSTSTVASQDTMSAGSIVTIMYGALEGIDPDVIVRATGGNGTWLVEDPKNGNRGDKRTSTLIIDFDDSFDQQARNDTHLRLNDYRNRRWSVEGVPTIP